MSKRHPYTNQLRRDIRTNIDPAFADGVWVRGFSEPASSGAVAWAGHGRQTPQAFEAVQAALTKAGWPFVCIGKKGTSGEYIVDVLPRKES